METATLVSPDYVAVLSCGWYVLMLLDRKSFIFMSSSLSAPVAVHALPSARLQFLDQGYSSFFVAPWA